MRLLIILPSLPWPPRQNGLSLRFGPLIEHLSARHTVDLIVLQLFGETVSFAELASRMSGTIEILDAPTSDLWKPLRKLRSAVVATNPWSPPIWASQASARSIEAAVVDRASRKYYDTILMGAIHMEMAASLRRAAPAARIVADFVDSPTLFNRRQIRAGAVRGLFDRYQVWKTERFERRVWKICDAIIYISNVDATTVLPGGAAHVIPNGVWTDDHDASLSEARTRGARIAFLGNMAYEPNVRAALRLAKEIFPRVLERRADAKLLIIGRDPDPRVLRCASSSVEVTGTIPNIWPYIRSADVCVLPMASGAGLQNKILDAMLGGVPVVASSLAAAGLDLLDRKEILIADTTDEFCSATLLLLEDQALRASLVSNAKSMLNERFAWPAIAARYESILRGTA